MTDELIKVVGEYALAKGEAWRTGEGSEIMDAYQAALLSTPKPEATEGVPCPTCNGTGKEGRHSICRDCEEATEGGAHEKGIPTKEDVRLALETIERANGADLDEWTGGVLPADETREALNEIKSTTSQENDHAR